MDRAISPGYCGYHGEYNIIYSLEEPPTKWVYLRYLVDYSLYTRIYFSDEKATVQ